MKLIVILISYDHCSNFSYRTDVLESFEEPIAKKETFVGPGFGESGRHRVHHNGGGQTHQLLLGYSHPPKGPYQLDEQTLQQIVVQMAKTHSWLNIIAIFLFSTISIFGQNSNNPNNQ